QHDGIEGIEDEYQIDFEIKEDIFFIEYSLYINDNFSFLLKDSNLIDEDKEAVVLEITMDDKELSSSNGQSSMLLASEIQKGQYHIVLALDFSTMRYNILLKDSSGEEIVRKSNLRFYEYPDGRQVDSVESLCFSNDSKARILEVDNIRLYQPSVDHAIIEKGQDELSIPVSGNAGYVYNVAVRHKSGMTIPGEGANWRIVEGEYPGIKLVADEFDSSRLILRVDSSVEPGEFTLRAISKNGFRVAEKDLILITADESKKIEITGSDKLYIPVNSSGSTVYKATVKDVDGRILDSESIVWAIYDENNVEEIEPDWLEIDAHSGEITLKNNSSTGIITIRAAIDGEENIASGKTVEIREAPASIQVLGEAAFAIPAIETTVTKCEAIIKDNNQEVLEDEKVKWEVYDDSNTVLLDSSSGYIINEETGELRVKETARTQDINIRATSASFPEVSDTFEVKTRQQAVFSDNLYRYDFARGEVEDGFALDLPAASYNVTVFFKNSDGLFTIRAEDTVKYSGSENSIMESFEVAVSDGQLNLEFIGEDYNITGIEISKILKFDFGDSDLADAYTRVSANTAYDLERGYGFADIKMINNGLQYNQQDKLAKDFVNFLKGGYTSDSSFKVDVPPGRYEIGFMTGENNFNRLSVVVDGILEMYSVDTDRGIYQRKKFITDSDDGQLNFTVFGRQLPFALNAMEIKKLADGIDRKRTVYLAGDSTVCTYHNGIQAGWGEILPRYVSNDIIVRNYAEGGASAKSFLNNEYPSVLNNLKEGDYFLIQYGINDTARDDRYAEPFGEFKEILARFIDESRAKGAIPILVTSQGRSSDFKGTEHNSSSPYAEAKRELAEEKDVLLIDLEKRSSKYFTEIAKKETEKLYMIYHNGSDKLHPNYDGAVELARMVAEAVKELDLEGFDTTTYQESEKINENLRVYPVQYMNGEGRILNNDELYAIKEVRASVLAENTAYEAELLEFSLEIYDGDKLITRKKVLQQVDPFSSKVLELKIDIPDINDLVIEYDISIK
ncbi:MAG: rhamnogalacturonan acetylesterase, partial [Halanaerobiales bacterium]